MTWITITGNMTVPPDHLERRARSNREGLVQAAERFIQHSNDHVANLERQLADANFAFEQAAYRFRLQVGSGGVRFAREVKSGNKAGG